MQIQHIYTYQTIDYMQCYYAKTRTLFDESNCLFNLLCLGPVAIRNIVREGYGIEGSCFGDILTTCCLPCCTGIQLRAEVNARGPVTDQNNVYIAANGV